MNLTIYKNALRNGLMNPFSLIINCAIPLILTIFGSNVGFGAMDVGRQFFLIAMLVMWGAFVMSKSVQSDKQDGVLIRILAGPVTMRGYLVQNFFAALTPMVILSLAIGMLGLILHSWDFIFTLGLVLCYIFLAATSVGLSFVWSCFFKDKEASTAGVSILLTATAAIGGFFLPLAILPTPIFYVGALFPAHWASRAIEQLLIYGTMTNMYWLGVLAMGLFTTAFILFGGKRRLV